MHSNHAVIHLLMHAGGSSRFGGGDKCSRCNKSVYAAERVIGAGSVSEIIIISILLLVISTMYYCCVPS